MFGVRNGSQIDKHYTRGKNEEIDVCYMSQNFFGLPRQSIRNNSDIIFLFHQTLGDVESMYKDISGYDMEYSEFRELCRKVWSEKFN